MSLGREYNVILILFFCAIIPAGLYAVSSNNYSDPYPVYSTVFPYAKLLTKTQRRLQGEGDSCGCWDYSSDRGREIIDFSISPFTQYGKYAKTIHNYDTELGDIFGRWHMVEMLYGRLPEDQIYAPKLAEARAGLFPGVAFDDPIDYPVQGNYDEDDFYRTKPVGIFSFPATYRKCGARVDLSTALFHDIGLTFQTGVSDILLTITSRRELNEDPNTCVTERYPQVTKEHINCLLMRPVDTITDELKLNTCSFHKSSLEDIRLQLFWQHAYSINRSNGEWERFLLIPYIALGGVIATGKARDPRVMFSVPFGNNGHNAVYFDAALSCDFAETIEICCNGGAMHFFKKTFDNMPVPTSLYQIGIYPFSTDVTVHPGRNYHVGLSMNAYHFLGKLSFYFQYVCIMHTRDDLELKKPDCAFLPKQLECRSDWKAQIANMSFNYDISPRISLGLLWQAPLSQRRCFKDTTILFSFNVIY